MKFTHAVQIFRSVRLVSFAVLLIVLTLIAVPASAAIDQTSFASKIDFAAGTGPYGVASADLNADGFPDVVVADRNGGTGTAISVLRNTSTSGSISFATPVTFTVGTGPLMVAIADLDGCNGPDIVVTNYGGGSGSTISVLLHTSATGSIAFNAAVSFPVGVGAHSVAIADFDQDGKPDIVVTNYNAGAGSTISVLHNSTSTTCGNISFDAAVPITVGSGPVGVAIADLDGGGKPDVVVTNLGGTTISVFRNTSSSGSILFAAEQNFTVGTGPWGVAIGYVDTDTKLDLVVTNYTDSTVSVLQNTSTSGSISFASQKTFGTGANPTAVAIQDLDGDGKADLAVADYGNGGGSTVSALQNTSTSGISFATKVDLDTGTGPLDVVVSDFDKDGKFDMVASNYGNGAGINVSALRNTSSPYSVAFASPVSFLVGSHPIWVAIADLDGDGKLDLVVTNFSSDNISVLRNTSTVVGTASFATVTLAVGSGPHHVAIGYIDGDTKLDLVVTNYNDGTISVLQNTSTPGSISFALPAVTFPVGTHPIGVAIGDLDKDGKSDVVVANYDDGTISALRHTSSSGISFDTAVPFTVGTNPWDVVIGDLNGDSWPDVAVSNYGSGTVSVLRNGKTTGSISLALQSTETVGTHPYGLAIADLDGNGTLDLATANFSDNTVSVLRNTGSAFASHADFATGTGPTGLAVGDLGGDAKPDLAVTNWYNGAGSTVSVLRNISTSGTVAFASKADFAAGAGPLGVAIGAIDPDGKLDLAVADYNGTAVSVLLSTTNKPTAVTLSSFSSRVLANTSDHVILTWKTASEVNTAGFNIYRSDQVDGPYVRINNQLIPSSADVLVGSQYEYQDNTVVLGHTYYYQLEDVETSGNSVRHKPIVVTVASPAN